MKQSNTNESHWKIGANYFLRTVTHHIAGRLIAVTEHELVLEEAVWIADDGRFTEALASCNFSEVELFPKGQQVLVGRAALIDAVQITSLPTKQK